MFCPYLQGTGLHVPGGHAEYMLMNADATYLIPDKVSYELGRIGQPVWNEMKVASWRNSCSPRSSRK